MAMHDDEQPLDGNPAWAVVPERTVSQVMPEPLGRPGLRHWKQASISDASLKRRGSVFFAAVEMTRMPIVLADPRQDDCPIVFANNAFLELTGYEAAEVLGRNCRFLQGAGTDPAAVAQLREAIHDHKTIALEILNYRRDGTPFWNGIFLGPMFDQDGTLLYFFASQLDVSRRHEAEQSLRQAQKMEAIGQLTAGLAHDFNNLLQVVSGCLERMRAKREDEASFERYWAAAQTASERGGRLTHQLLAFARRTRLEPQEVDLSALVNSFGELLETSAGQKVELHLNLQRRLPPVRLDPSQLEMALLNVVVNARDASPERGAVTVTTRIIHLDEAAAHHLDPGEYVLLAVVDQGMGMPPDVRMRATEPFFTTKGIGHGTGLGLAMAQGFVQQSGGRLEIDSEVGQGTTIRMIFPCLATTRRERPFMPASAGYQAQPVDASAPPLVLVVDDNREIADMAGEMLGEVGYRVAVTYSAEEALERFEAARIADDPVGLVFSDVLMPGGANGLVLAEQVRKRDPSVPVLMTTGYNDEMSLDAPQAVALEVLGKPYRRSELIDRVQAALRHGARTGPARETSDFGHARE